MTHCNNPASSRLAMLATALALGACAMNGGAADHCDMAHITDLKLERHGQGFYTTVGINAKPVLMRVDTGSELNLIRARDARALGLTFRGFQTVEIHGVGGLRSANYAEAHDVRLGEAHGSDLDLVAVDEIPAPEPVAGILGMDFLYSYDIDLDFVGGRLRLYKALHGCSTPQAVISGPLYEVDLVQYETRSTTDPNFLPSRRLSPAIAVTVNGVKLRALVDTGADHTFMFRNSAARAGISQNQLAGAVTARGVGPRAIRGDVRIGAPVTIGDLTISNMPIVVGDQRSDSETGVDVLLGNDFLTRVHVWISHSSNALILQFPPTASPEGYSGT